MKTLFLSYAKFFKDTKMATSNLFSFIVVSMIMLLNSHVHAVEWFDCPDSISAEDLKKWRTTLAQKVLAGEYESVKDAVKKCFGSSQPKCYNDLIYYADYKSNPAPYALSNPGFQENELTLKSEKDLPAELLAKNKRGNIVPGQIRIPENIKELAAEKGWDHVLYKTRSSGGFDSAPNLFMIGISTKNTDIFIQTSPHPDVDPEASANDPIPKPANGDFTKAQGTLTIITVDKTQSPPVGQLRKLRKVEGSTDAYRWSNDTSIGSCTSCHTQPLRPISPIGYKEVNGAEILMDEVQTAQVDALNRKLELTTTWGTTKVNDKLIRLGPAIDSQPLGWAPENSSTRGEEFLKKCSKNPSFNFSGFGNYSVELKQKSPPNIDYSKLAFAMNCVECHTNSGNPRGRLHEGYSMNSVTFKVAIDRSMPHGIELNIDERLALISCLEAERIELKDVWRESGAWMEETSCWGDQFQGNPPVLPTKNNSGHDKDSAQGSKQ